MPSNHHTDEVFTPKKRIKGEIKFQLQLNDEQKEAKKLILGNVITIITGKAGSGKSAVAAQAGLDLLFRREIEKIIITRALVTPGNEEVGILPGGINEKLSPFTAPVYDNMYRLYSKEKIDNLINEGKIEVIPLAYMRGRNFSNSRVIVDVAQNMTEGQIELVLSRLCQGSRIVLCGDPAQIDLKDKKQSGYPFVVKAFKNTPNIGVICLKQNHRHPIVDTVLEIFNDIRD